MTFFSTSTPLIPSYIPRLTASKRVDFVIVLNPEEPALRKIEDLRAAQPELSINHCSHESLYRRPVAVTIETKKGGASDREAQLQVGTWLAAQFNLLRDLVDGGGRVSGSAACDDAGEDSSLREDEGDVFLGDRDTVPPPTTTTNRSGVAGSKLQSLPFLPAIIVHGHDWIFCAATQEGQRTVLWTDLPFGSTRDTLGIYKIVAGLQHIARYVEGTFWPWYQDAVLGMETPREV